MVAFTRVARALGLAIALASSGSADAGSAPPPAAAAAPGRIDSARFAALPEFTEAQLSPDGDRVLFRGRKAGATYVGLTTVDRSSIRSIDVPDGTELNWTRWAGDRRVLLSIGQSVRFGGEDVKRSVLMLYDLDTRKLRHVGKRGQGFEGDDVLWVDPDGHSLLLSIQRTIYDWPSVYRVSLDADGAMKQVVGEREPVWEWYADRAGVVRAGSGYSGGRWRFFYRQSEGEAFRAIGAVRRGDEDGGAFYDIARIVTGSDDGYVLSDETTGRTALYRFNYRTRELGELVYGNAEHDISDYWLNEDGTALDAVTFTDVRDRVVWFDADDKRMQALIDAALGGSGGRIVSRSRDGRTLLVLATAANDPGLYYLLDRDTLRMTVLSTVQAALEPEQLATTRAVRYPARDGQTIPAFLTLPPGRGARGLPLVIMPHGGPYGVRDKLDYDAEVQFLANRSYAVLQPNYRGSGGYGSALADAGKGQIGRAMQDDLDDGMDWLAGEGTIDPARVCVVGGSYGGYAALWAVIRNPERYRCAASFAGVTDWKRILRYDARYLSRKGRRSWNDRVRGGEEFDLDSVSPALRAASLTRPVLIGQGDADTNVPIDQARRLVNALRTAGKPYDYKVYEGEGHGFSDPANRKDRLDRLDAFLARHNPA